MAAQTYAGICFEHCETISAELDVNGDIKRFLPQSDYKHKQNSSLHDYGDRTFCKFSLFSGQEDSGVFIILSDDQPVYIGKCKNISRAFGSAGFGSISPANCYKNGQITSCRINNLIYQQLLEDKVLRVCFHPFEANAAQLNKLKMRLIAKLAPSWNRR